MTLPEQSNCDQKSHFFIFHKTDRLYCSVQYLHIKLHIVLFFLTLQYTQQTNSAPMNLIISWDNVIETAIHSKMDSNIIVLHNNLLLLSK